jgi:hypothetical protein
MSDARIAQCKQLLSDEGINPASTIEYDVNGTIHTLSLQEIIETYMQASEEAQLVFVAAMHKAVDAKTMGIQKFFEGMGKLLLMSRYSEGDITSV